MSQVLQQLRRERSSSGRRPRLMERFADFLPLTEDTPPLGLGEGFTPLVRAHNLGRALGVPQLYLKVEGQNPTGSFKDRGMVVAVAKAIEDGARAVICASTGNTSASAAAYAASAGIEVVIVLPKGKIAAGKMLQGQAAGARVVAIDGNFDDALRIVREMTARARPDYPSSWSTRSTPTASRARRRRPSRSARTSAARPTTSPSRSATPATSPPTGRASRSTATRASWRRRRR